MTTLPDKQNDERQRTTQARPTMVNGFDDSRTDALPASVADKVRRRNKILGPAYRLFYETPLELVRGSGTYVYDSDGNEYLDAYNNVPCVGHAHPRVVEAVHQQMRTLNTNTRYLQESILDYTEQLLATFPTELGNAMYTCTGSEANDLALRVAHHVTGNQGIIVTANAYHGVTSTVAAMSPSLGQNSPLGPHVRLIAAPDIRCASGDLEAYMRAQTVDAIADLHRHGYGLAAFVADSIFSSDGVFADPPGFLVAIGDEVHRSGGLYIADEVQPGFGRTGDAWWGFQRHGLVPDIVTLGKPMGNGIPIAAAIFRPELLVDFGRKVRYFNTFGGNTVSIAAAQAVLDVIRDEQLIDNAAHVGRQLLAGVQEQAKVSDQLGDVRGAGLFVGVDVVSDSERRTPDPGTAARIVNSLRARRVLISASGPDGNVLKVRPPMAFRSADADRFLDEFHRIMTNEGQSCDT